MNRFDWGALPAPLARDLATELGLRRRGCAEELARIYPNGPDVDFVRATWPVLRDRWVVRDPGVRVRVVSALRAKSLGDLSITGSTVAAQKAYLTSCRNATSLRRVVLGELMALGSGMAPPKLPRRPGIGRARDAASPGVDAKVEHAWDTLRQRVQQVLAAGADNDHVVIELDLQADGSTEPGGYYVQWGVDRDSGIFHAEAVSNAYLPPGQRLTAGPLGQMMELGWEIPDGAEGGNNFRCLVPLRRAPGLARLLVRTLREVYGAPHPAFLTAHGVNDNKSVDVSALGLQVPRREGTTGPLAERPANRSLRAAVAEALTDLFQLGEHELIVDKDGDYPVRCGSAMVFIRVLEDPHIIDVFSPVLVDVIDTDGLRRRLIDLQASAPFVKFTVQANVVTANVQLMADKFQVEQLARALALMTKLCDDIDDGLQGDFGGRTFFGLPAAQPTERSSALGGYL